MMGFTSPAPDEAVPTAYATRPTMDPTDRSTLRVRSTSTWPTATVGDDGRAGRDVGERAGDR